VRTSKKWGGGEFIRQHLLKFGIALDATPIVSVKETQPERVVAVMAVVTLEV
jgi:hypothetical protein